MATKGKRANIGRKEQTIMDYALDNREMCRTPLAEKMKTEIKWEGKAPAIEVLERKISWYWNHAETGLNDQPWSMATLDRHPIPPAALLVVLAVWKHRHSTSDKSFSIREAKWAARLSPLLAKKKGKYFGVPFFWKIADLSIMATVYARAELTYDLIGKDFDSTFLDPLLVCESIRMSWGGEGDPKTWTLGFMRPHRPVDTTPKDNKEGTA